MAKQLLLLPFLMASQLYASDESMDVFSLSLDELTSVDITGSTLTSETLKTVPAAVTVYHYQELQRLGLDTLDELMNLVPGFQSYRDSALHYPFSARGRRIASPSSEILVMVDGHRLEDSRNSGSAGIAPKFQLAQIERVEFIRGPGAAVYGSNAMTGVINIITLTGLNELSAGYGSYNRRQAHVLTSYQIGYIDLDLFAHMEADDGDNYQVQDTFSSNQIKTDDPREIASVNLKLRWFDTHINLQHSQFKVENFYELNNISNDLNKRESQLSAISLKQNFYWQNVHSFAWLSYNISDTRISAQNTAPGDLLVASGGASSDALTGTLNYSKHSEIRTQWHNDWKINPNSSFQWGLEYRHINAPESKVRSNFDVGALANSNFPIEYYGSQQGTTPVQTKSTRDISGLYSQYLKQLFESTHLTLGLRYDNFSGIGSKVSPRLALVQAISEQHNIKLLYGEAFRAPSESELNLANNPLLLGNPALKPETIQTWELVWVAQWAQTGLSLGYFESRYEDSIVRASLNNNIQQFQNIDQDPTKGFEFELSHEINSRWFVRSSYTYRHKKPDLSFREADQLASLILNYQQSRWNINLIGNYQSEREMPTQGSNDTRISLNGYWQFFGKLSYSFTPNLHAFLQAKNLLDKDFATPASSTRLTDGIPNRGQEVLSGITWTF